MPFAPLIAAAGDLRDTSISPQHAPLAWAALRRLRNAFPDNAERSRSLVEFARAICDIKEVPGRIDDLQMLNLVFGGGKISEDMHQMVTAMDRLDEQQKVRLEALQDAHMHAMAEFFAETEITDLFPNPIGDGEAGCQDITEINGIGAATALHLAELNIRDLRDLANLSDARLAEVEAHMPHRPGGGPAAWRVDARAMLAEG